MYGRVAGSAVAVVGIWDPLSSAHMSLLTELRDNAAAAGLSSVVVLIDPAPGVFSDFARRYGTGGWPVYDGVTARISLIRQLGVNAVLRMRLRRTDFDATAAQFLDAVRARVELEELWLGATQLLGPGTPGRREAVAEYADDHGFRLSILPRAPVAGHDVRSLLASGRLRQAVEVVGRPPTWRRPRSGALCLAWRPGTYRAIGIDRPVTPARGAAMDIALEARLNAPAMLPWPHPDIHYLAFTSGPADLEIDPRK
jgi:FAD synthase